jgi:hypothetical protein
MPHFFVKNEALAIVIPAYRAKFLEAALQSVLAQTDQRFNLYVFDDASPEPVQAVVEKFQTLRPLTCHRFTENMGGRSLAGHWSRCIALSQEPWVWLFSDDDVMEPECVASFYRTLAATAGKFDVYRFDTVVIDENGGLLRLNPPHPEQETWRELAYFLLRSLRVSTAQEVIVSRAAYELAGGWFELPLAWGSDHASQMIWAGTKGLRRIDGARVRWRWSGQNVSSTRDRKLKMTKVRACMAYVAWLLKRVQEMPEAHFPLPDTVFKALARDWFIQHLAHQRQLYSPGEAWHISRFLSQTWGGSTTLNFCRMMKINLATVWSQARDVVQKSK